MKTTFHSLLLLLLTTLGALAQGSLTPPGGVILPTMKSLDQIEPARPLVSGQIGVGTSTSGTLTISQPGSYYLTGNLTVTSGNGITIASNDVSLDLRGFIIASTTDGSFGIGLSGGITRIDIRNGTIRGSSTISGGVISSAGFGSGIDYSGAPGIVHVANLLVEGVGNYGIDLGGSQASIIESCVVRTTNLYGMNAGVITDSVALNIIGTPIFAATANNCIGKKSDGTALIVQRNPQGDARTSIASVPYIITAPGSYYLAGNLTVASGNAITISASGVTLDLNGFSITSTASALNGRAIDITGSNVTIRNGMISGTRSNTSNTSETFTGGGFSGAIYTNGESLSVEKMKIFRVGFGIVVFKSDAFANISDCHLNQCSEGGIYTSGGLVRDTVATRCGGDYVIYSQSATNCVAEAVSNNGYAIYATGQANNCVATGYSDASGLYAGIAINCSGETKSVIAGRYGIIVTAIANSCRAIGTGSSTSLFAPSAIGCRVAGGPGTITNKYNMP